MKEFSTEFIHYLQTPICILSFDGEFIDINEAMLNDAGTLSKLEFFKLNSIERVSDKKRHLELLEPLLKGGEIKNKLLGLKRPDGSTVIRLVNISILSKEHKLIIHQNYGPILDEPKLHDRYEQYTHDLKKLKPFLNANGKILLEKILNKNFQHLKAPSENLKFKNSINQLSKVITNFTEKELYVAAMLSNGLTNKEICNFSNITQNNLRVIIHRISKKLNIKSKENIVKYLHKSLM